MGAAVSVGQGTHLALDGPVAVLELEDGYGLSLSGDGFYDSTPVLRVFDGTTDISSLVTVTVESETRLDSDYDGVLESYAADLWVEFGNYTPNAGHVLRVEAEAYGRMGPCEGESSTLVRPHLKVRADDVSFGESNVHVSVRTDSLFVGAESFRVLVGSNDVTAQVSVSGPFQVQELVDSSNGFVQYRLCTYEVDVSSLGQFDGVIHFVASTTGTGSGGRAGTTEARDGGLGETTTGSGGQACNDALDDFMEALGLQGDPDADPPTPVEVTATPAQVSQAAQDLQEALEANGCDLSGSHAYGGYTMIYDVGKDGGSNPSKDSKASGSADLVVSVGGDSATSSSGRGGNATASNSKPGGASVAAGGNGGGGVSNPGSGGSATSTITTIGGQAAGSGQGAAFGGRGGAHANPTTGIGGSGGNATIAANPFGGNSHPGQPGQPGGVGGGGAWVYYKGFQGWL